MFLLNPMTIFYNYLMNYKREDKNNNKQVCFPYKLKDSKSK